MFNRDVSLEIAWTKASELFGSSVIFFGKYSIEFICQLLLLLLLLPLQLLISQRECTRKFHHNVLQQNRYAAQSSPSLRSRRLQRSWRRSHQSRKFSECDTSNQGTVDECARDEPQSQRSPCSCDKFPEQAMCTRATGKRTSPLSRYLSPLSRYLSPPD